MIDFFGFPEYWPLSSARCLGEWTVLMVGKDGLSDMEGQTQFSLAEL
jgi:hypothetical protein